MKNDIYTLDDVKFIVDDFYGKVRKDDLLASIFDNVIKDQWPKHLDKMYRFWQTVLLGDHTYYGSPFVPHAGLPVEQEHFDRWLKLFSETVDENYDGENAKKAKWQADRMAAMFLSKIKYYRANKATPLI